MKTVYKLYFVLTILLLSQSTSAFVVVDGVNQTSGFNSPIVVDLEAGSNNFSFVTDTNLFGPDLIQFTIEENQSLSLVTLLNFVNIDSGFVGPNQGFFGIIDATTYVPPETGFVPDGDDLLAGVLFGNIPGSSDVGTNILDNDNIANGNGSLTELTAGEYIFWFNETRGTDIFSVDFFVSGPEDIDVQAVPLPIPFYLMLASLSTVMFARRNNSV